MIKKQCLCPLLENKLDHIIDLFTASLPTILAPKAFRDEINDRIKEIENDIKPLEDVLNINEFISFWNSPQVANLISDFFLYELIKCITRVKPKKEIYYDDLIIHCQHIIENYYKRISDDTSMAAIKKLFDILHALCCTPFQIDIYLEQMVNDNSEIVVPYFYEESLSEKKIYSRIITKIQQEMSASFIPDNPSYSEKKAKYIRVLRQAYQNGFVYLLGEYKFNEFYIPPIVLPWQSGRNYLFYSHVHSGGHGYFRNNWKRIFSSSNIVYVVGGAGYGKSLFLSNIINNYSDLKVENTSDYLVLYCDLKSYYNNGNDHGKTILSFLHESIINQFGIDYISTDIISYYLQRGRCIILLDALDEVTRDVRSELHKKIATFFSEENPNNLICITSRDRGFIPQKEIEVFEILPLTEKDIEDYLDKMIRLGKFKRSDKDMFMDQASTLIQKKFLNNFLVLSLLVNIFKSEKALPENKVDLYKKCFEYIAKKREEEKSKIGYNWNNIYPLMKDSTFIKLAVLAAPNNSDVERALIEETLIKQYRTKYIDEATTEVAIKEFLEFCSNRTELFVPAAVDDKFKFFHRSFFEYFYARYIHQQHSIEDMYKLLEEFDIDSEVFELTIALVKEDNEEKYQDLIEYMFMKATESLSDPNNYIAFGMLTLAMQVIDDAYFIKKYYSFVVDHPDYMCSKNLLHCNQKYISTWVEKAVGNNTTMQTDVCSIFKGHCLFYIFYKLLSIDRYKEMSLAEYVRRRQFFDDENGISNGTPSIINSSNIPFYIILLDKYCGLSRLLEETSKLTSTELLEMINMPLVKKQARRIRRGFERYKRLGDDEKKYLMSFIAF